MKITLSKGIVDYLYGSRMTMEDIVTYLNENYGNGEKPFNKANTVAMFKANGYNLRNRPRKLQLEIVVLEDDVKVPEVESSDVEEDYDGPDFIPNEEEVAYL